MSDRPENLRQAVDKLKNRCPAEINYVRDVLDARRERLMFDMAKFSEPKELQMQVAKISALTEILSFLR